MPTSRRLAALGNGTFARCDRQKLVHRALAERGEALPLIDLSLGSSDLPPPQPVLEAMAAALPSPSSSAYCLQAGTAPFRSAVAAWCHRRFGVTVDPDREVLLLIGSQEGTAHLPLAVLDPGDAALLLDPCYPSHRGGLILADADIQALPLREADGWRPDLESLPGSAWDLLRLFVLGYPHNPTARVGDQDLLDQVMAKGVRHELVIAHDNPYVDLALEGEAPSLLCSPGWRSWGIEFFSLSKGWGLGGFRLAFAVGAPPLIEALGQVKAVVDFNQSLALQRGGITALTQCADWPQRLRTTYRSRRDGVLAALAERKWGVPCPEMGMYLWMPLPSRALERGWSDEQVASDLLRRSGVALTPGSGFGSQGSGWLRMALVRPVEELQLAVDRLAEALAALD